MSVQLRTMAPFGFMSVGNVLVRTLGLFSSAATVRCSSIAPVLKHFCTSIGDRPKLPLTAYVHYVKAHQDAFKRQYPDMKQVDVVKKMAQHWRILTPDQKRPFEELSSIGKQQYQVDLKKYMAQLTPAQTAAMKEEKRKRLAKRESKRKKRELNSLGKPKRSRSSFNIFMSEHFEETKGNVPERLKSLMKTWRSLDTSQKQVYVQLAEDDKIRYKNEINAWEEHMIDLGKEHLVRKTARKKLVVKTDRKNNPRVETLKAEAKKSTVKGKAAERH